MAQEIILILGGTGVIGSHLAKRLAEGGHQVKVLSRSARFAVPSIVEGDWAPRIELVAGDMNDVDLLMKLVQQADIVMHQTQSVGALGAVENAGDYTQSNIGGTANLVGVLGSGKQKVRRIILGSSISVYGEGSYNCKQCGPVRPHLRYGEQFKGKVDDWDPPCPHCASKVVPIETAEECESKGESIYAVTKKAQEDLLRGICNQLGISLSILRYTTLIGPWQSWHNPFTRFLELLVSKEPPVLHEDGMQSRDFISPEDIVRANLLTLDREVKGVQVINVGSGEDVALLHFTQELARQVAQTSGGPVVEPIVDGHFVQGDVRHCRVATDKAREVLGFKPSVSLKQSIADLAEWFVRHKAKSKR